MSLGGSEIGHCYFALATDTDSLKESDAIGHVLQLFCLKLGCLKSVDDKASQQHVVHHPLRSTQTNYEIPKLMHRVLFVHAVVHRSRTASITTSSKHCTSADMQM
jgi:hypothetical protein